MIGMLKPDVHLSSFENAFEYHLCMIEETVRLVATCDIRAMCQDT